MSKDGRLYNSSKNAFYAIFNKLAMVALTFISRKIFLSVLSAEYLGIGGLFGDVLTMLSLADLGLGTAMAYSYYKPLAENDTEKVAALNNFFRKVYNVIAAFVAVAGLALTPFIENIINTDQHIEHIQLYYVIFLSNTAMSYLFSYKAAIISADQKSHLVSKYNIVITFVKTVAQILVLIFTHSYLFYILLNVASTLAGNLLIAHQADKYYKYIIKTKAELPREEKISIFQNVKSVFIYKVSGVLLNATDNTLISVIVSTAAVGMYSNYNVIISNLNTLIQMIFTAITPSLGNLVVTSDHEKRYSIFKIMQMCSFWLSSFFVIATYFLTEDFIGLWLGKEYLFSHLTFVAILFNFYLSITLQPVWAFREATGLYRKIKYVMLVTAGVNVVFSIILGMKFGIGGIIFASFLARVSTYFWYEPPILFREQFGLKVGSYYGGHVINLLCMFCALGICYLCTRNITVDSVFGWIIKAVVVAVIVNIFYLVRYVKTKEFSFLIDKVKNLRGR